MGGGKDRLIGRKDDIQDGDGPIYVRDSETASTKPNSELDAIDPPFLGGAIAGRDQFPTKAPPTL